jgi:hypothetical protein
LADFSVLYIVIGASLKVYFKSSSLLYSRWKAFGPELSRLPHPLVAKRTSEAHQRRLLEGLENIHKTTNKFKPDIGHDVSIEALKAVND